MNEEFWNSIFEVISIVLPFIITGICTFFITKYSYHKDIPLDKMEISYNRVYYPICCLVKNEKNIEKVVGKCELYLKKYHKYVDRSTRIAFNYLKDTYNSQREFSKKAYDNFKNNIFTMDSNLRRRLGYLEPNIIYLYAYAPPFEKRILRISIESLLIYVFAVIISFFQEGTVKLALDVIFFVYVVVFIIEIAFLLIQCIFREGKKLVEKYHWKANRKM